MDKTYKVAGYVKLAKLWERTGEEAIQYHNEYFQNKYDGADEIELVGVYVDITGQKEALRSMVNDYVNLNPADYSDWRMQIYREINKVHE